METICKIVKSDMVMVGADFDMLQINEKYKLYKLYLSKNTNPYTLMFSFVNRKSLNVNIKKKFDNLLKSIYSNGMNEVNNRQLTNFHIMLNNFNCQSKFSCTFKQDENENHIELNISQLRFIFIVLIFGFVLSIYCLVIENLYNCFFN